MLFSNVKIVIIGHVITEKLLNKNTLNRCFDFLRFSAKYVIKYIKIVIVGPEFTEESSNKRKVLTK